MELNPSHTGVRFFLPWRDRPPECLSKVTLRLLGMAPREPSLRERSLLMWSGDAAAGQQEQCVRSRLASTRALSTQIKAATNSAGRTSKSPPDHETH